MANRGWVPTGIGHVVVIQPEPESLTLNNPYLPRGGREQLQQTAVNQRAVVEYGHTPATTLAVVLRSIRIGTSSGYLVALVDGRDQVADWQSVRVLGDLDKARTSANRLVDMCGGVAEKSPLNGDGLPIGKRQQANGHG